MAAAAVFDTAVPPPLAQELPPLVGEPMADGDEPPIVIAEAYLTPANADDELQPSVTAVFVASVPIEPVPDPGDAPPPAMQPPNTPPLAASAVLPYEASASGAAQALVVATSRAPLVPAAERGDGGPPMTVEEALAAASAEGISLEPSANAAGYRGVKVPPVAPHLDMGLPRSPSPNPERTRSLQTKAKHVWLTLALALALTRTLARTRTRTRTRTKVSTRSKTRPFQANVKRGGKNVYLGNSAAVEP